MSSFALNNLINLIRVYNQKKIGVLKVRFFKKCIDLLHGLTKEGFVRGYFISLKDNKKVVHILLKYINNFHSFNYRMLHTLRQKDWNNFRFAVNSFNFFVLKKTKNFPRKNRLISNFKNDLVLKIS